MKDITLIFISLTYARFFSKGMLPAVKARYDLRIIAVLEAQFADAIPESVLPSLDEVHLLPCADILGTPGAFSYADVKAVVENEMLSHPNREIRLICSEEFNLVITGQLRRELHLPGPDDHLLIAFRDKVRMKSRLERGGVRVPRYVPLGAHGGRGIRYDHTALTEFLGADFIVKPIDGAGSAGVRHIRSESDFAEFNSARAFDDIEDADIEYEAEEFIDGTLYHVDSIFQNETCIFRAISEYSWPNFEFTKGKVLGSIPVPKSDPLHQQLGRFADDVHAVMKPTNFSTHLEVFVRDGTPIFLEIAARSPGTIACRSHLLNYGVNIMDLDFTVQSRLEGAVARTEITPAFWAYFPKVAGWATRRIAPDLVCQYELDWLVNVGDKLSPCRSVLDAAGVILATHPDPAILRHEFDRLKHFQALHCVPANTSLLGSAEQNPTADIMALQS